MRSRALGCVEFICTVIDFQSGANSINFWMREKSHKSTAQKFTYKAVIFFNDRRYLLKIFIEKHKVFFERKIFSHAFDWKLREHNCHFNIWIITKLCFYNWFLIQKAEELLWYKAKIGIIETLQILCRFFCILVNIILDCSKH